jgi:alpha-mannosidase
VERRQQEYDVSRFSIEHPAKVAPMQRFVTVKDREKAFTLFSYGLPEYELKLHHKGTLALTLLRCVGTLAADKPITRPGGKAGWHNDTPDAQCQGRHTVRYGILLHSSAGIQGEEERNEASEQFHLPFISVRRKTAGALPTEGSFMSVTPNFLVLSALKESEDGKALIARISNPGTINATGALQCAKRVARAALCRLDETETAPADVVDGKTIPVHLPPAGIVTLRISLEE